MGVTLPLVNPAYTPDGVAGVLTDGTSNDVPLSVFPSLGHPHGGFDHSHD